MDFTDYNRVRSAPRHFQEGVEQILELKMTKFRPCIDLHSGQVKQIVGGTLSNVAADLKTNYVSKLPAGHYAELYRKHDLRGGHVVMLGPGNDEAAHEALRAWPNGLQVAGGITDKNAQYWIDQGAEKVSLYACACCLTA